MQSEAMLYTFHMLSHNVGVIPVTILNVAML